MPKRQIVALVCLLATWWRADADTIAESCLQDLDPPHCLT